MNENEEALENLRRAYRNGNLVIYAGAGVSVGSGLPSWQKLVLAMYFSALSKRSMKPWQLYPSYLFATAEWHLENSHEPLEITARKIRRYYEDDDDFLQHLWETLYAGFLDACGVRGMSAAELCSSNRTLDAVARLCKGSVHGNRGVRSVITYNYDNLLEISLADYPFQVIYKSEPLRSGRMPIYHVHGYVPLNVAELRSHELVFTEDQYHQSAKDAYSWSSLMQIQSLSSSTGIMIGLSLADRNMRRLLDVVSQMPIETRNYALLREPSWKNPDEADLLEINERARLYRDRFENDGPRPREGCEEESDAPWQDQIAGIIDEVRRVDVEQQTFILKQLGVHPVWFKEYSEIPPILASIAE